MAPYPGLGDEGTLGSLADSWAVLSARRKPDESLPDHKCTMMLMAVSLGVGLLSTVATSFAFYWFVKMRRSFRHDLIMLLIQADWIKAVWFVIFPIYTFIHGPVESTSGFCQFGGFSMALALEMSDIAVLLIALHSAMYIWRPQSGIYPYRWMAYGVYTGVPVVFASLAFADQGYENVGYFCYLPNKTGWSRLVLSWIPRHIVFASIIVIYSFIYIYVRIRITRYERRGSQAPQQWGRHDGGRRRLSSVFETTAAYRDRIRSLPTTFRNSTRHYKDTDLRRSAPVSNATFRTLSSDIPATGPVLWNLPNFKGDTSSTRSQLATGEQSPKSETAPIFPAPTLSPTRRSSATIVGSSSCSSLTNTEPSIYKLPIVPEAVATPPSLQRTSFLEAASASHRPSSCATIPAMFPVCRKAQLTIIEPRSPRAVGLTSSVPTTHTGGTSPSTSNDLLLTPQIYLSRNRDKVRRQLRSLFVYPLLYLIIWIFPIVNQAYGYIPDASVLPPTWLLVCSLTSLALQGAADSAVFTAREKPWRYTYSYTSSSSSSYSSPGLGNGSGFWEIVKDGNWWAGTNFFRGTWGGRAGKSREEMLVDERIARARREAERVDEFRNGSGGGGEGQKRRRHWWEGREFDV